MVRVPDMACVVAAAVPWGAAAQEAVPGNTARRRKR